MKQYDVIALGELLIDFAPHSVNSAGYPVLSANPGGAPGNFLAALAKYGCRTAMIGKVGDDTFGRLLKGTLQVERFDLITLQFFLSAMSDETFDTKERCQYFLDDINYILEECGMTPDQITTTDGVMEFARKAYEKGYYAMAGQVSKNVFCIYDLGGFML